MRAIRSMISQSPAIAISLAALVFALGGGAGYAATSIARDTTRITLHPLPLGPHWHGSLRYGINDSVVYLAGDASKLTGRYSCMTTLPKGARPTSSQLDIPVTLGGEGAGVIRVLSNGQVCPFGAAAQLTGCSTAAYFVKLHRARRRLELAVAVAQQEARQGQAARGAPRAPANRAGQADPVGSTTCPGRGAPTASPGRAVPSVPGRLVVTLGQAGSGELTVKPDGQLTVTVGVHGTAHGLRFVSLSGVSFLLGS